MKIDRLLGILTILAQRDRVKVKELAEHFEVSARSLKSFHPNRIPSLH